MALAVGVYRAEFFTRLPGATDDSPHRPDEYAQYLEYAHRVVFGNGFVFWEHRLGVRTPLISIPAIIVLQLCKSLGLGHPDYCVPSRQMFEHHAQFTRAFGFIFFLLANKRRICRPTGFDYILLLA